MKEESCIERLLRHVYSCDTEAGNRLRYHYTKAVACPEYANKISLSPRKDWEQPVQEPPYYSLLGFCIFQNTKEGHDYWYNIVDILKKKEK